MTLKKSMDDGASWQVETLIYAGPAAYSLVVPLTNDSLGVVYERNGPGETQSRSSLFIRTSTIRCAAFSCTFFSTEIIQSQSCG